MTTVTTATRGGLLLTTTRGLTASGSVDGLWRGLACAGATAGAVVHLLLWADGFRTIAWIGPLFLLDVVAGLVVGLAVVVLHHWLTALAVALFGLGTLMAFQASVWFGLFDVHETWNGWPQVTAGVGELVALVGGVALLLTAWRQARA